MIKNQLVIEEKSSTKNVVHVLRQETCHTSNFKNKFRQILWQVARTEASRDMYAHTHTHIHTYRWNHQSSAKDFIPLTHRLVTRKPFRIK